MTSHDLNDLNGRLSRIEGTVVHISAAVDRAEKQRDVKVEQDRKTAERLAGLEQQVRGLTADSEKIGVVAGSNRDATISASATKSAQLQSRDNLKSTLALMATIAGTAAALVTWLINLISSAPM